MKQTNIIMSEKEISQEESLKIISDMIGQAKSNVGKGGSFYFLMWGFVVAIANLSAYYLAVVANYPKPYIVWLIMIPAVIATIVYSVRHKKSAKVHGHLDKIYGQMWMGVFVCIMITLVFMNKVELQQNAIILLITGLATFVSGRMLNFTPLVLGGIALWIASVFAFTVSPVEQNLVAGIAIIVGYIIPGFLLRKEEQSK